MLARGLRGSIQGVSWGTAVTESCSSPGVRDRGRDGKSWGKEWREGEEGQDGTQRETGTSSIFSGYTLSGIFPPLQTKTANNEVIKALTQAPLETFLHLKDKLPALQEARLGPHRPLLGATELSRDPCRQHYHPVSDLEMAGGPSYPPGKWRAAGEGAAVGEGQSWHRHS